MITLNDYLNARLKQIGEEFEELKREGRTETNRFCARRLLSQADELSLLAQWVEDAESSFKTFFEALSESISEWIYQKI